MGRRLAASALVSLVLLAGCATARPPDSTAASPSVAPPTATSEPDTAHPSLANGGPCLPPGVASDFLTWPVRSFQPIVIPRDDDTVTAGAWVLYGKGASRVAAIWGGEELIAVDPSPTTDTPIWVDRGRLDDQSRALRSDDGSPCQWRRHGERRV